MIKLKYSEMKFKYITNYYDYPLSGTCIYNNKLALFKSKDETDYQTMNDTCPCCSKDGDNWEDCHCENAPDLYYYITELPLVKRIFYRLKPYYSMLWYIRNYGLYGIHYWKHWKRG